MAKNDSKDTSTIIAAAAATVVGIAIAAKSESDKKAKEKRKQEELEERAQERELERERLQAEREQQRFQRQIEHERHAAEMREREFRQRVAEQQYQAEQRQRELEQRLANAPKIPVYKPVPVICPRCNGNREIIREQGKAVCPYCDFVEPLTVERWEIDPAVLRQIQMEQSAGNKMPALKRSNSFPESPMRELTEEEKNKKSNEKTLVFVLFFLFGLPPLIFILLAILGAIVR